MEILSKFKNRLLDIMKLIMGGGVGIKLGVGGWVGKIEKALINDGLYVSKVSWKFRIPTAYNFAVIYPWNLLFS